MVTNKTVLKDTQKLLADTNIKRTVFSNVKKSRLKNFISNLLEGSKNVEMKYWSIYVEENPTDSELYTVILFRTK